jgi:hypothetical protein
VLDYQTRTVLNADILPGFHLDLTHYLDYQPTGGYAPLDPPQNDGNSYFSQADQSKRAELSASLTYSPVSAISLTIVPHYLNTVRQNVVDGVLQPQRIDKTLDLTGLANVNVAVGRRGQLSGQIGRLVNSSRTTTYNGTVPQLEPLADTNYWTANLSLTWSL